MSPTLSLEAVKTSLSGLGIMIGKFHSLNGVQEIGSLTLKTTPGRNTNVEEKIDRQVSGTTINRGTEDKSFLMPWV